MVSYNDSMDTLREAAENNDTMAQWYLSERLNYDYDSMKESYYWCQRAAEGGNEDALYMMACVLSRGDECYGVEKDIKKAAEYYIKSAEKNHSLAIWWLAEAYDGLIKDSGVVPDRRKAEYYYEMAIATGNEDMCQIAERRLAGLY